MWCDCVVVKYALTFLHPWRSHFVTPALKHFSSKQLSQSVSQSVSVCVRATHTPTLEGWKLFVHCCLCPFCHTQLHLVVLFSQEKSRDTRVFAKFIGRKSVTVRVCVCARTQPGDGDKTPLDSSARCGGGSRSVREQASAAFYEIFTCVRRTPCCARHLDAILEHVSMLVITFIISLGLLYLFYIPAPDARLNAAVTPFEGGISVLQWKRLKTDVSFCRAASSEAAPSSSAALENYSFWSSLFLFQFYRSYFNLHDI